MKTTYYRSGANFIAVTNECPPGFKGVAYIGKGGPTPAAISEQVWAVNQLVGLEAVALADVPDEWVLGFGYDAPVEVIEEPIFDLEGDELLDLAPIRRRPVVIPMADDAERERVKLVGFTVGILVTLLWYFVFR